MLTFCQMTAGRNCKKICYSFQQIIYGKPNQVHLDYDSNDLSNEDNHNYLQDYFDELVEGEIVSDAKIQLVLSNTFRKYITVTDERCSSVQLSSERIKDIAHRGQDIDTNYAYVKHVLWTVKYCLLLVRSEVRTAQ